MQIVYAKRISRLHGANFDADVVEMSLMDSPDSQSYFKQQNDIRRSFCINSNILRKFTLVRHIGGTRVPIKPIMDKLSRFFRVKSYNSKRSASYKVGEYSKMYIFTYEAFIELCQEWHNTAEYSPKFDLGSEYYKDIIEELLKHFELKFLDFNKFKYRRDSSNV